MNALTVGPIGLCADADLVPDPDVFFPVTPADFDEARSICAICPVAVECLTEARARGERYGVWGGKLFEDGRETDEKRPIGRPRKVVFVPEVNPEPERELDYALV